MSNMAPKRQQIVDFMVKNEASNLIDSQPLSYYISRHAVIDPAKEEFPSASDKDIQDAWADFKNKYVRPRPTKNADLLNLDALERASNLGVNVEIADKIQKDIVDVLVDAYNQSPSQPTLGRDDFLSKFDHSANVLDQNIYALKLKGVVELNTAMGTDGFFSIELSKAGIRQFA